MNNIVLLCSDISKGMKSYGPKAVVPIGRKKTPLIVKQIDAIKKLYKNIGCQIYIVVGFDKDRICNLLKEYNKYQDVIILEHKQYVKDNQGSAFMEAIKQIKTGNLLVIQNGILSNYMPENPNQSTIPIIKKPINDAFPVGVRRSSSGDAEYLFYGLEYGWPEICYFASGDYHRARELLMTRVSEKQKEGMFLFEYLNYLIEHQYSFHIELLSHKHIKKVINYKEIC